MRSREKKRTARVKEILAKWVPLLGLTSWQFTTVILHKDNKAKGGELPATGARIITNTDYLSATIFICPDVENEDLEEYLVHELLHAVFAYHYKRILAPIFKERITTAEAELLRQGEEHLAEVITRAFLMSGATDSEQDETKEGQNG